MPEEPGDADKFIAKFRFTLFIVLLINVLCMIVISTMLAFTIYVIIKTSSLEAVNRNTVTVGSPRTFDDNVREVLRAEGKL